MKKFYLNVSALFVIILSLFTQNSANATFEEAEFLSNVAKQYMLAQFDNNENVRYIVKTGKIDPNRDYGGKCSGFLTAELQAGQIKKNNVVKITCSKKDNSYTLFVPVSITTQRASVIANTNIPKGTVITDNVIEEKFIDENTTSSAIITNKAHLIGSKAKKDIRVGESIKINDICTIAKGDVVVIEASNANLTIKTQGVALTEGSLNDTIQVRNSKSKKVIEAQIVAPGIVKVAF